MDIEELISWMETAEETGADDPVDERWVESWARELRRIADLSVRAEAAEEMAELFDQRVEQVREEQKLLTQRAEVRAGHAETLVQTLRDEAKELRAVAGQVQAVQRTPPQYHPQYTTGWYEAAGEVVTRMQRIPGS